MKYEMEKNRFTKLFGEAEITKTAQLIADRGWFSLHHCVQRLRKLSPDGQKAAMRMLRAAQYDRVRPQDKDQKWLNEHLDSKVDLLRFFIAPAAAAVYQDRAQPVVMNGAKIGITLRADRMPGNKVRVYYSSKVDYALELDRLEAVVSSTGSELLDNAGLRLRKTVFHVKQATSKRVQ